MRMTRHTAVGATCALLLLITTSAAAQPQDSRAPAATAAQMSAAPDQAVDLLIQGAVDTELQPLLTALEGSERVQIGAWTFWRGRMGGKRVVISRTEVGNANAAASTALGIMTFHPKLIINQGTAGAVDPALKVFDIIVGESTVDYGSFQSAHADLGAGVDQARWTPVAHRIRLDGGDRVEFKSFPGDAEMMKLALATPNPRGRVLTGVIGSAYEFNRELDRLVWMRKTFGASTEDMESAFAAVVATGFKTPFLAVRMVSDNEFTAPEFQRIAGEYCAAFVADLVKGVSRR
jgi:adenosylhomocysteine nucleosidase